MVLEIGMHNIMGKGEGVGCLGVQDGNAAVGGERASGKKGFVMDI